MSDTPSSSTTPERSVTINGEFLPGWLFSREFGLLWERSQRAGVLPSDLAARQKLVDDALLNSLEHLLLTRHAEKVLPAPSRQRTQKWRDDWLRNTGGLPAALERYQIPENRRPELESIIRMDMFYHELTEHTRRQAPTPGESDIQAYHAENLSFFTIPETARFQQVFRTSEGDPLDENTALLHVRDSLLRGGSVAQVASLFGNPKPTKPDAVYSTQRTSEDPIWQEVADAAFALQPGAVSDIVQTPYGRHVIKLLQIIPETVPPLEDVRAYVLDRMQSAHAEKELGALADQLRASANIQGLPGQDGIDRES